MILYSQRHLRIPEGQLSRAKRRKKSHYYLFLHIKYYKVYRKKKSLLYESQTIFHCLSKQTKTEDPYTNKQTRTDSCTPPPRSRPYGGLHKNRSFVTHDVPGQGIHYR